MAEASLNKLAQALEKVEAKLAKIEGLLGSGSGAGASSSGPASGGASLEAWDALVAAHIPKFVADSKAIAADVGQGVRGRSLWGLKSCASPFCSPYALIEDFIVFDGVRYDFLHEFQKSIAVIIHYVEKRSLL